MTTTTFIILGVIAVIAVLAFFISRQPDVFRVTRTAKIKAPAPTIYPWLNNLKKGAEWSPWVEMDPDADYSYAGPDSGPGANTTFDGKKCGSGKLTITGEQPNERVTMRLEFTKPMKCVNTVEYVLEPAIDGTTMTWTMFGPNNFMGKVMGLVMNCEKMCGDQFLKGMENLKRKVEG